MEQATERRETYERLVRSHAAELYRFAFRLCGHRETAEDLVQETYSEAWRSLVSLRDAEVGRAWLFQILRNRYSHWVRDSGRRLRPTASIDQLNGELTRPGPDVLGKLANQELIQEALDALDDRYKEPFLMVFAAGLTCQQVADQLQMPLGTVLSRIHRARLFLRRFLREIDQDSEETSGPFN
jgi:RNA polymerase sigma-70 factor (ECF subfamily)